MFECSVPFIEVFQALIPRSQNSHLGKCHLGSKICALGMQLCGVKVQSWISEGEQMSGVGAPGTGQAERLRPGSLDETITTPVHMSLWTLQISQGSFPSKVMNC